MDQVDTRKTLFWIIVVYLLLVIQIIGVFGNYHDDAFITFQYGANLASGNGLVFNEGEKLMGSTSPGQTILCALMYFVSGHDGLPDVMIAIGCIGWTLQGVAIFFLLRRLFGPIGAGFIATCIAVGAAQSYAWVSLETNVTCAFALFSIVAAVQSKWKTTAVLVALAGFMRPDAYILAPLLAGPGLLEQKKQFIKPVGIFLALSVPWFLFAYWYFGSPIPQSAVTKFHNVDVLTYAFHLLTYPLRIPLYFARVTPLTTIAMWIAIVLGSVLLLQKNRRMWFIPAYVLVHFLAYLYLRPFMMHVWHLYPGTLLITVLFLVPIAAAYGWSKRHRVAQFLVLFVMTVVIIGYAKRTYYASLEYESSYWGGSRHKTYVSVAEYIKEHGTPTDSVASVEVGTIGYLSGLKMYDLGGLITQEPSLHKGAYDWLVFDGLYVSNAPSSVKLQAVYGSGDFKAFIFRKREPKSVR